MASLFHIFLSLIFLPVTYCLADDPTGQYCNQNTVINRGSYVSANIDHLLADVVSKIKQGSSFVESSYGNAKDKIYGLAQCRGDVDAKDCLECIQDAAKQVRELCPNQTDARIWYNYCLLRYSQNQFFGNVDTSYGILYANVENVTDPDSFNKKLGDLFDEIDSEAVKPSNEGLGKDKKKLSDSVTLYGLVQCTKDLPLVSCAQCLAIAIQNFDGFCSDKKGCRVFYSSCFVRYELYPFYFPLDSAKTQRHTLKKSIVRH